MKKTEGREKSYPTIWIIAIITWVIILASYFISGIDATLTAFLILIVLVSSAVIDWLLSE